MKFVDLNYENSRAETECFKDFECISESGHYLLGNYLKSFESQFAKDQNAHYCLGVKNATDAIAISLRILGAPERTVIVPQFGAYPTVIAALQAGSQDIIAAPVDNTMCLDLSRVHVPKRSIIVPVNLFGNEADLGTLDQIANSSESVIVEDCAQSTGIARKDYKSVVASIHSFYPTKPLGSRGDGGAILTNNDEIELLVRKARFYGMDRGTIDAWGFNSRMDEWQSAFLSKKMTYYREMNAIRKRNASLYDEALGDARECIQTEGSVYHQYVTLWKDRDLVQKILHDLGISTMIHYPKLITDMPYLRDKIKQISCKRINDHILSLPVGPHLTEIDLEKVANTLRSLKNEAIRFQDI